MRVSSSVVPVACSRHLESNTLSPILRRLQALGLVQRERADADERVTRVHVTEAWLDLGAHGRTSPARR
ncbi:hypothetical protein ACIHDR_11415 [Nocardia sp. NPDC052278]|uniref:transcriptional regulator, SarA/Rot family n=1 Tax=unclassified Nocardia TaxID=2637762 RepID=UPI0036946017